MADTILSRSIRAMVARQYARLVALDAFADLAPFRLTLEQVRAVEDASPMVLEVAGLLEAEIAERERVQARAKRVVSDGESKVA